MMNLLNTMHVSVKIDNKLNISKHVTYVSKNLSKNTGIYNGIQDGTGIKDGMKQTCTEKNKLVIHKFDHVRLVFN